MANEKRLIDADALMEAAYDSDEKQGNDVWHTGDIEYLVMAQPTVDAVEVVRCKDCKYHHYICLSGFLDRKDDDFCSYGKRRTE